MRPVRSMFLAQKVAGYTHWAVYIAALAFCAYAPGSAGLTSNPRGIGAPGRCLPGIVLRLRGGGDGGCRREGNTGACSRYSRRLHNCDASGSFSELGGSPEEESVTGLLRLRGGGGDVPEKDWHLLSLARAMVVGCERGGLAMDPNSAVARDSRVKGARLLAALRARTAALASCGEQGVAFAKELTALQTRYETLVPPVSESYVDQAEALLLAAGGPHGGPRGWEEAAAGNSLQGGTLSEGEGRMRAEHAAARHSLLADAAQQEEGELDPDEVEDAAETQRLLDQLTDVVAQFKTSSAANLVQIEETSKDVDVASELTLANIPAVQALRVELTGFMEDLRQQDRFTMALNISKMALSFVIIYTAMKLKG